MQGVYLLQNQKDMNHYFGAIFDLKKRFAMYNAKKLLPPQRELLSEMIYCEAHQGLKQFLIDKNFLG
jgi:predicted GIY-YIG superfamily endonuclease